MSLIWVDKYKPKNSNELVGQRRSVDRIKSWLRTFDASRSKPMFIYGPPGIGKTTAAHLCCKELGYHVIEFNASDQRNKNIMRDVISTAASNTRISFTGRASETKDAIILDEIDGMAGNEDRGGVAQLIVELKSTKKPMIFICNDGQHQKLRSLKDKCENLEFKRPDLDTIKALVNKVAANEHIRVKESDISNLAESSDYDIRQVLNSLSMFKGCDSSQVVKTTRLNAFEATKAALSASKQTLENRFDCFFADYNIMSLFMYENYTKNRPVKGDQLQLVSKAADALCLSDLAEKEIRSNQCWSLLNAQALLSTVIPSKLVESHNVGRVDFPQFLGKLSNANKRIRLTQELNAHMCLTLRGGLDPDYLDVFRERLSSPLIRKEAGGIDAVIDFMHEYNLIKDDITSIMELATWSFKPDPMVKVDSKTKTALTLACKKRSVALPYFVDDKSVKKRKTAGLIGDNEDDIDDDEEEEEEITVKPKRVIKNDKPAAKKKVAEKSKSRDQKDSKETKNSKEAQQTKPSEEESVVKSKHAPANGKAVDKRPPAPVNGIARFFEPKKTKFA